jgi:demethylmenaquinone methyltransferase/2-methoxy-6-polyprenyl-1,4-benzoquinol methylase
MPVRKGVQKIYTEVAKTYELVNHVLTLGLDIHWRKKAARMAAQKGGNLWLDVCCGTGEMAQSLSRFASKKKDVKIFAVDFSYPMLKKAMEKRYAPNLFPVIAEASVLPFQDESFDLLTISFATRNLNPNKAILESYLEEFSRILRPGGYFVNLETSQPTSNWIRPLFHFYVKKIVKPLGWILSGSKAGYSYLSFTIPRFYASDEFTQILAHTGFAEVDCRRLFLGISAIHVAKK